MAILRYLTKLTGLQAGDEPEVHEIPLESSEPTNVGQLTARLSRALKARLVDDIDSAHGDILNVLYRQGPTSMTDLARRSHRTKATVTVLVKKLESLGYVLRCANTLDGRSCLVDLTDKGNACRQKFEAISKRMDQAVRGALSVDEIETGEGGALKFEFSLISNQTMKKIPDVFCVRDLNLVEVAGIEPASEAIFPSDLHA